MDYKPAPDNLFTPNVKRGDVTKRYRLYRHGANEFSATPDGPRFTARVEADACGMDCYCGGFITPNDKQGKAILATAKKFK